MLATTTKQIRVRVPAKRVRKVRHILDRLGTDAGGLINILYAQIEREKRIPLSLDTRDPETVEWMNNPDALQAIASARAGRTRYTPLENLGLPG
jgi:antitoxin component of RelBE/YafQ-DinJ toxin-antitoxin module